MSSFKLEKLTPLQQILKEPANVEFVGITYMRKYPAMVTRSYDGEGNNLNYPNYGRTQTALKRKSGTAYGDGISTLANRTPTPREISNAVVKSTGSKLNSAGLTDFVWLWGQLVDHELDLTSTNSAEPANMTTPNNDTYPNRTILFDRSTSIYNSSPRQQPNLLTAFLDGSVVYGSDTNRCYLLRSLDGTGKLKTTISNNGQIIPPYNTFNLDNAQPANTPKANFFVAGDVRINENVALTAIQTLLLREHNRLATVIKTQNPGYSEEEIFQKAKRKIGGFIQKITYDDFLPLILGTDGLTLYTGYKPEVDATVSIEFSTVGFRVGHTMVSSTLSTGGNNSISLVTAFFNPSYIQTNGVDALLLGASQKKMQEIDNEIIDDLRDFLFGPPTSQNLLDLASLNIQRGRDHGIPDYNSLRVAYGLPAYTNFTQISTDNSVVSKLQSIYSNINAIDPWVGALSETHIVDAQLGPLLKAIWKDQFERSRDGDRYWWKIDPMLEESDKIEISQTKLSDIINRNCSITVSSNVFKV